jgi:hypothetical protein
LPWVNTFAEYCGSHPHARPDRWRELYRRHQDFLSKKAPQSPFISLGSHYQPNRNVR